MVTIWSKSGLLSGPSLGSPKMANFNGPDNNHSNVCVQFEFSKKVLEPYFYIVFDKPCFKKLGPDNNC